MLGKREWHKQQHDVFYLIYASREVHLMELMKELLFHQGLLS